MRTRRSYKEKAINKEKIDIRQNRTNCFNIVSYKCNKSIHAYENRLPYYATYPLGSVCDF